MLVRRVVLALGLAALLALLLTGCGAYNPRLLVNVALGPKAHQAAIRIKAASGSPGFAYVGIVLTYPDGHRRLLSSGDWGLHDGPEYDELDGLPSGVYTLTAYAVTSRTSDELSQHGLRGFKPFPVSKMVEKNIVASATFVVP